MITKKNKNFRVLVTTLTKKMAEDLTETGKKSFSVEKKKPFKSFKDSKSSSKQPSTFKKPDPKKNFARKFVEQQATKSFIKKDDKPTGKSKLKLKGPIDRKDLKLTVARAMNVEEIEIKQRSLASVKRARLKDKKTNSGSDDKREFKKVIREVNIPEHVTVKDLAINEWLKNLEM